MCVWADKGDLVIIHHVLSFVLVCIGCQNDIIRMSEDMSHMLYTCRGEFHMLCV